MRLTIAAAALGALALTWQDAGAGMALDPSFGTSGTVRTSFGTMDNDTAYDLRIQPDGSILAAGISTASTLHYIAMSRYSADGVPDSAGFGTDGKVHVHFLPRDQANAIDLQDDGRIVAVGVGSVTTAASGDMSSIYRFHPWGQADDSFAGVGWDSLRYDPVSSGEFAGVEVLPDGRILAAGRCNANANGGVHGFGAMRFLADGSLDPSFDGDGRVRLNHSNLYYHGAALFPPDGGVIWINTATINGRPELVVARVDSVGMRDPSFGPSGIRETGIPVKSNTDFRALLLDDGRFLLACTTTKDGTLGGAGQMTVIRFLADGTTDGTFGTEGRVDVQFGTGTDYCYDVAQGPDGRLVLAGAAGLSPNRAALVGLFPDGTPDPSFGAGGKSWIVVASGSHWLTRVLWLPDGRILAAARVSSGATGVDFLLARFEPAPGTDVAIAAGSAAGALGPAFPNPSRGATTFRLELPRPDRVSLDVFDVAGRPVRRVAEGSLAAGAHALAWDGRDASGRPAPAGVYFVRLRTSAGTEVGKVTRVR